MIAFCASILGLISVYGVGSLRIAHADSQSTVILQSAHQALREDMDSHSHASLTGSIALGSASAMNADNASLQTTPSESVPVGATTPKENPSQLASAMAGLNAGDVGTWAAFLLVLAVLIIASMYLYIRLNPRRQYSRFDR